MDRQGFLKSAVALAAGSVAAVACGSGNRESEVAAPNLITQKNYKWYMVTTWPPNFPVMGTGCTRFAESVREMSGGQLDIRIYGAGELIPALEVFDAVSAGTAQIGHSASYYWTGKVPAAQFFTTVPFGMNAPEQTAWVHHGGGLELWRKIYAPFHLRPFLMGDTNLQMGGWFNKEVNVPSDFKNLKIRMPGIGGKIIRKLGATPVLVAGGEIYTNLERGVIDAAEWIGPFHDQLMGFQGIARYYYSPGWQEPCGSMELIVNEKHFTELPDHLQKIIETCAAATHDWIKTEMFYKNAVAFQEIKDSGKVEFREFSSEILSTMREATRDLLEDIRSAGGASAEIYDSYFRFENLIRPYSDGTEKLHFTKML